MRPPSVSLSHVDAHVGRLVAELRTERHLSQGELASHLQLTADAVEAIEAGERRIRASELFVLAGVFGTSTEAFYVGLKPSGAETLKPSGE